MKASEEKRSNAEGAEKSENGASTRLTLWQAGAQQAAPLPIQTRMQQHGCGLSVCGHGMPCPYQPENNSTAKTPARKKQAAATKSKSNSTAKSRRDAGATSSTATPTAGAASSAPTNPKTFQWQLQWVAERGEAGRSRGGNAKRNPSPAFAGSE